jgi:hypothetical protein
MPRNLLQKLSEQGIDPVSLYLEVAAEPLVGISSASGPAEDQAEIDAWVEAGGVPDFDLPA